MPSTLKGDTYLNDSRAVLTEQVSHFELNGPLKVMAVKINVVEGDHSSKTKQKKKIRRRKKPSIRMLLLIQK